MAENEANDTETEQMDEANPPLIVDAGKLFGDSREIWIELDGVRYRLRITRRNKLILQK